MIIEGYEWLIVLYLPFIFWSGDSVRDRLQAWKDRLMKWLVVECG